MGERVIALVDMDCFYCQVEERLNPELKGKPTVVVQYNPWKGGGIIAVNYEARAQGVKRGMRGEQAKQLCPDVVLCSVPMIREKADLGRYRDAGREVIDVMCKFSDSVQRASIDEAYLDLTSVVNDRLDEFKDSAPMCKIPNTFVVGYSSDSSNDEVERAEGTGSWLNDLYSSGLNDVDAKKLAIGAVIVEEMRQAIVNVTGFKCSAGIAHNKILAKLAAGMHKPNRQTVLPHASVAQLFTDLPVYKIRNLGGKLGRELEEIHGVKVMADLLKFTQAELTKLCDERMGNWLYHIARGHDNEPVTPRLVSKSIACCKNFPGKMSLSKGKEVEHWLNKLTEELLERLLEDETMNQRKAQHMVFSIRVQDGKMCDKGREIGSSKSVPLYGYNHEKIVTSARTCLKKFCTQDPATQVWSPIITFLGLSAGKFVDTSNKLMQLFNAMKNNRPGRLEKPIESLAEDPTGVKEEPGTFVDESSSSVEVGSKNLVNISEEVGKSKYFERPRTSDIELSPSVQTDGYVESAKASTETVQCADAKDDTMNQSSLDESVGPSFFERMLLDNIPSNGKRIKLNIFPPLPQVSPRKPEPLENDVSNQPVLSEPKDKTNKISDFFAKSPSVGSSVPQLSENSKMAKAAKDSITTFFAKRPTNWVDPQEIFPDAENIDEATLALFPMSYQKKILELKNLRVKETEYDTKLDPFEVNDGAGLSDDVCCEENLVSNHKEHSIATDGNCNSKMAGGSQQCEDRMDCESRIEANIPVHVDKSDHSRERNRKYEFHDSQQPSTSKCGQHFTERNASSSPEDMFAGSSPYFSKSGPSKESTTSKWFSDDSNQSEDELTNVTSNLVCPDCQIFLPPDEFDEHRDYHFALKLQEQMNQPSGPVKPHTSTVQTSSSKPFKRKSTAKKTKIPESKKIKNTIELFFKKAS